MYTVKKYNTYPVASIMCQHHNRHSIHIIVFTAATVYTLYF